jgi:hypothetical protein
MYGLVPYNISPIQQGIQFGHAVVEYGISNTLDHNYIQWAHNDKTFIILNGGTTNYYKTESYGTLNQAHDALSLMNVETATFHEPDLGDQLTAVVFLVDERVWNKEKYPEYDFGLNFEGETTHYKNLFGEDAEKILEMREFLSNYRLA